LNYERINQPLSRNNWPQSAACALKENPVLFAAGGQNNDFHVIYCRLPEDKLLIGQERPVVNQLLKEHQYSLFVFSNQNQDRWHFINVKYDDEVKKRRLFRRISIGPEERLRTASQRINMLDLQALQPDMFGIPPLTIQSQYDKAFDVEAVTDAFFEKYKNIFEKIENNIEGIKDKEQLRLFTQKLFNRLMFIAFIEKKGWLKFEGKTDYLDTLWHDYKKKRTDDGNFYRDRLHLLFFAGLNNTGNINIVDINKEGFLSSLIGEVPYLNGGLFEKEDDDSNPDVKVPDICFKLIFEGLFSSFNFTVMESTPFDVEVAVDPEMLGKIFERLVTGRHKSGSYYTPKTVVSFMCREALKEYLGNYHNLVDKHTDEGIDVSEARTLLNKLANIKICDPACGSGAYLVGMLHELHGIMNLLDTKSSAATARDNYSLKLDIIQNNLFGVDIDPFAVNIAKLRLWLTLAVEFEGNKPEPLPNLDYKLEVGDSLTAPNPQLSSQQVIVGELAKKYKNKTAEYLRTHHYGEKAAIKADIDLIREEIRSWTHAGEQITGFDWMVEFADVFANGGFDVILANPPYGITCNDSLRFEYFPRIKDEDPQSKDSYGLFIARGLQLLKKGAFLTYIVSDTWRTIRTHRPLRKKLLSENSIMHVLDLPSWIFDATVNTCILSAKKQPADEQHQLVTGDLRNLPKDEWTLLEQNLTAISGRGPDCSTTTYARYTYPQKIITTYDNLSLFIGSPRLYALMIDNRFVKLGTIADVKQGLATADNEYYLRKSSGARGSYQLLDESELLTNAEIANLSDNEKKNGVDPAKYGGRHFVPYDKGGASDSNSGWLPNYWVPTEYFIDWSKRSVHRLKTKTSNKQKGKIASRFQNSEFYFKEGISFSDTGFYAPTFRIGSCGVFDVMGMSIFFENLNTNYALAILTSKLIRYIIKIFINHSVHTQVEGLKPIPLRIEDIDLQNKLIKLVEMIINKQKLESHYPYYLYEQKEIDTLIYQLYGLNNEDIREVELWYCRRYPKLAEAQGILTEVKEKYGEHLERCDTVINQDPEYWKSDPILQLIAQGENSKLEFKESLEIDKATGNRSQTLVFASLRTIDAFLNTDGGILVIGVNDSGEIMGLSPDYNICNKHDKDGFEQKIHNLIRNRLNPFPAAKITVNFPCIEDKEICRIGVGKSNEIIYVDGKDVFVREGNTSHKLEGPALVAWSKNKSINK